MERLSRLQNTGLNHGIERFLKRRVKRIGKQPLDSKSLLPWMFCSSVLEPPRGKTRCFSHAGEEGPSGPGGEALRAPGAPGKFFYGLGWGFKGHPMADSVQRAPFAVQLIHSGRGRKGCLYDSVEVRALPRE